MYLNIIMKLNISMIYEGKKQLIQYQHTHWKN